MSGPIYLIFFKYENLKSKVVCLLVSLAPLVPPLALCTKINDSRQSALSLSEYTGSTVHTLLL